ncbi:bifunctional tetrahydrofolate synthase/dihydrofolate synthase [Wielerella bovis]|uniref:bifunctional tetrahydrofolate synthase/dihydrofolate synthase n=1 Tax=Wielerella bovis TaxID=2917790 RepID=UPI00201A1489|nr:bifunctional tetrahydrofolate synthase/dihydrofolate synthase [Wielerella bovis]ULJ63329.1 bifunctional tetrahydrofolate synthase/dihydrofolate synthase [Wielerella bovis]
MQKTLSQWLAHLETAHSNGLIDMGLTRITQVKNAMQLTPTCPIIIVGGTNGKGSTCAFLSHIYRAAGYTVGTLTSPHLLRFNERIALNCQAVDDAKIVAAFERIEVARGDISLTYFEFNTLAAVDIFQRENVDVMILEVGLGGRLDAVNIFDADCTIITSVDLDHQNFLGDTIEQVGYEKAGIFRVHTPAICGQNPPPQTMINYATEIGADLHIVQHDFTYQIHENTWDFSGNLNIQSLPHPALHGSYQFNNAACALQAIGSLKTQLPVSTNAIAQGLQSATNIGRFQIVQQNPMIILDVGHNPHAARALSDNFKNLPTATKRIAVFSILADKDIDGVLGSLKNDFDDWYIAPLDMPRGMNSTDLLAKMQQNNISSIKIFQNIQAAYQAALSDAQEHDRITIFGSFHTVSAIAQMLIA